MSSGKSRILVIEKPANIRNILKFINDCISQRKTTFCFNATKFILKGYTGTEEEQLQALADFLSVCLNRGDPENPKPNNYAIVEYVPATTKCGRYFIVRILDAEPFLKWFLTTASPDKAGRTRFEFRVSGRGNFNVHYWQGVAKKLYSELGKFCFINLVQNEGICKVCFTLKTETVDEAEFVEDVDDFVEEEADDEFVEEEAEDEFVEEEADDEFVMKNEEFPVLSSAFKSPTAKPAPTPVIAKPAPASVIAKPASATVIPKPAPAPATVIAKPAPAPVIAKPAPTAVIATDPIKASSISGYVVSTPDGDFIIVGDCAVRIVDPLSVRTASIVVPATTTATEAVPATKAVASKPKTYMAAAATAATAVDRLPDVISPSEWGAE
jgi:hypothetical protein